MAVTFGSWVSDTRWVLNYENEQVQQQTMDHYRVIQVSGSQSFQDTLNSLQRDGYRVIACGCRQNSDYWAIVELMPQPNPHP